MDESRYAGINGISGRIGRLVAYELVKLGVPIGAGNDLATTDEIVESLSHHDGVHGKFDWEVRKTGDNEIAINGKIIQITHERDPANIIWARESTDDWMYVSAVAECAGLVDKAVAEKHFASNAGHLEDVIISAPGKGEMKTLVMGINHTDYAKGDRVTSNASCTTKALAVPLKVLMDAGITIYGVLMDTTHAATNTQKPLDFMAKYGVLDVIGSAKTGAAVATGQVIPTLEGKMDGFAMRVPTRDGSFVNAYLVAEGPNLSKEYINEVFKAAVSNPAYLGRLDVHHGKEISSPEIIGNTASGVIALSKTKSMMLPFKWQVDENNQVALVGFVSGYDNERGPAKDLAMLMKYVMDKR